MNSPEPTQRVPPSERFAVGELDFDLRDAVAALRQESRPATSGHRQQALYRRGGTTLAVFTFEPDAVLEEHSAPGLVIIQGLEGRLAVRTPEREYTLTPGRVVALAPGTPHAVRAHESSAMLLTVSS